MAQEKVFFDITMNGADKTIKQLQTIEDELKKVSKAKNKDKKVEAMLRAEKKRLNAELNKSVRQFNAEKNAVKAAAGSYDQLVEQNKSLVIQMRRLSPNTKKGRQEIARLSKTINGNTDKLKKMDGAMGRSFRNVGNYKSAISGLASAFLPAVGVGGLVMALKGAVKMITEFEQSIANLSAITGASGKDLDFLRKEAIRLGSSTTLSASQVSEAFKLIASAKPELLANTAALAETTEATIMLSEAAGIEMTDAAKAVASSLNQFGEGAEMAEKFVDILAAGSKFGAGDINFLNVALVKAGVVAKNAGLSFQETAAALEVLAEKGVPAETAGANLRNILLKLQKEGKGFVDGKFNLQAALSQVSEELSNIQDPATKAATATKLFGSQNIASAQSLMTNSERLKELTGLLDINGVASEQQRINTDTLDGATKALSSAYEGFILSLDSGQGVLSTALRSIVEMSTAFLQAITPMTDQIEAMKEERTEMNLLVDQIKLATKEGGYRKKLINELNLKYPTLLGNLSTESITNSQLAANMKAVNEQMIAKILLATKDELIEEKRNEASRKYNELDEKRAQLKKDLLEMNIEGEDAEKNLALAKEKTAKILNLHLIAIAAENELTVEGAKNIAKLTAAGALRTAHLLRISEATKEVTKLEGEYNELSEESLIMSKQRNELAISTGIIKEEEIKTTKKSKKAIEDETEAIKSRLTATQQFIKFWEREIRLAEEKGVLNDNLAAQADELIEKNNKLVSSGKNLTDQFIKDEDARVARERALDKQISNEKIALTKQTQDAVANIIGDSINRRAEAELAALEKQKEQNLISEEQFEQKSLEIKRRGFKKVQALKIAEIVSNLATELVLAQKFEKGGLIGGGVFEGNSHAQGGVKFSSGGRVMEAEGGEAIINRQSTSMYKPLLSAINQAGGGKKFAFGGITPDAQLQSNMLSEAGIGAEIARQMGDIKVVNVVADTTAAQISINNVESEALF